MTARVSTRSPQCRFEYERISIGLDGIIRNCRGRSADHDFAFIADEINSVLSNDLTEATATLAEVGSGIRGSATVLSSRSTPSEVSPLFEARAGNGYFVLPVTSCHFTSSRQQPHYMLFEIVAPPDRWLTGSLLLYEVQSQSDGSNLPPHSRHTMNSWSNRSNGPQSRPCVSVEVAIRNSPSDEPQSGHAILHLLSYQ